MALRCGEKAKSLLKVQGKCVCVKVIRNRISSESVFSLLLTEGGFHSAYSCSSPLPFDPGAGAYYKTNVFCSNFM